jgi:hypothetical protein
MIAGVGRPDLPVAAACAVVLLAGATIMGGQPGINAMATFVYPTQLRATGVGWCLGIGRAGSIAVLVPTVITPGEWNVLLNPLHSQFSLKWITTGPDPYSFDAQLLPVKKQVRGRRRRSPADTCRSLPVMP